MSTHAQPPELPCNVPWSKQPLWTLASGQADRMWRFRPHFVQGYTALLERVSLRARNLTTNLYDAAVAPEWWVGFLDVDDDPSGSVNENNATLPAALIQPLNSEPLFFELAGVFALVRLTNGGVGFAFPTLSTRALHAPALIYARGIGANTAVRVTPTIKYVRDDLITDVQRGVK